MFPTLLTEEQYIDRELEANYTVIESLHVGMTSLHKHDFFELMLVTNGSIEHIVNGHFLVLTEGDLSLIRPDDIHYYQCRAGGECRLVNFAYPRETIQRLFQYLGDDFNGERLLETDLPPCANLSRSQKDGIVARLDRLDEIPPNDKMRLRLALRGILLELLAEGFPPIPDPADSSLPSWMQDLIRAMEEPENYLSGFERMRELAVVSPEHMARSFRRFLDVTPTEWINGLRLKHAANLLLHTDSQIKTVALESGFESTSYFFHLFHEKYEQTPSEYRKARQKNLVTVH